MTVFCPNVNEYSSYLIKANNFLVDSKWVLQDEICPMNFAKDFCKQTAKMKA